MFKRINLKEVSGNKRELGIYGADFSNLGEQFKSEKIGFNITSIAPGKFLCPFHFHHHEEELFLVLEGEATVRQGDEKYIVTKDDLVFFNLQIPHQFFNHGNEVCRLLAMSNKNPNDICEYPDSKKVNYRYLHKIYKDKQEVDYFEGEEEVSNFWKDI